MQRPRSSKAQSQLFLLGVAPDFGASGRPSGLRAARTCMMAIASGALVLTFCGRASAQQPQFARGFQGAPQGGAQDSNEASAYAAAINQPSPDVRASALQQFLVSFPNSPIRQQAIGQMMLAKRQTRYAGSPAAVSRPMGLPASSPAASPPPAAAAPVESPAPQQAAMTPRDSLLQQAAKHAEVSIAPHALTVKADNSALSQILHDISGSTGMTVEGLSSKDDRVFGNYGPGDAREVLLALLAGSGYNVVMLGETATGTPRELSLTPRTTSASASASATTSGAATASGFNNNDNTMSEEDEDSDQDVQQTPPPEPVQPQPAGQSTPPGVQPGSEGTLPRSQQEIQQEIQRLRQQQQPPN